MSLENSIIAPVLFKQVRILAPDTSSNIGETLADVLIDQDRQIFLNPDQDQISPETKIDQRLSLIHI